VVGKPNKTKQFHFKRRNSGPFCCY